MAVAKAQVPRTSCGSVWFASTTLPRSPRAGRMSPILTDAALPPNHPAAAGCMKHESGRRVATKVSCGRVTRRSARSRSPYRTGSVTSRRCHRIRLVTSRDRSNIWTYRSSDRRLAQRRRVGRRRVPEKWTGGVGDESDARRRGLRRSRMVAEYAGAPRAALEADEEAS